MGAQGSTISIRDDTESSVGDDIRMQSLSTSLPQFASTAQLYHTQSAPELQSLPNPIRTKELLKNARHFYREKVRLPPSDSQWAKQLVYRYSQKLLDHCKRETKIVRGLEYAGSMYERLETKKNNDFDFEVKVVLKTEFEDVLVEDVVPRLYSKLKLATNQADAKLVRFTDSTDHFRPDKVQNWLDKLAEDWSENSVRVSDGAKVRTHKEGSAVQMDIRDIHRGGSVSAQLIPCLKIEDESGTIRFFVPCAFQEFTKFALGKFGERSVLWRETYSVDERELISSMDRNGSACRLECLKILKHLFASDRRLRVLSFYLLKTAFLHYQGIGLEWRSDQLGERLLGVLRYVHECVKRKDLPHYFVPSCNLLKGLSTSSLQTIERRLRQITTDEKQLFSVISV